MHFNAFPASRETSAFYPIFAPTLTEAKVSPADLRSFASFSAFASNFLSLIKNFQKDQIFSKTEMKSPKRGKNWNTRKEHSWYSFEDLVFTQRFGWSFCGVHLCDRKANRWMKMYHVIFVIRISVDLQNASFFFSPMHFREFISSFLSLSRCGLNIRPRYAGRQCRMWVKRLSSGFAKTTPPGDAPQLPVYPLLWRRPSSRQRWQRSALDLQVL